MMLTSTSVSLGVPLLLQFQSSPPRALPTRCTPFGSSHVAAKAAGGLGYVVKPRLTSDLVRAVSEAKAHRPFVSVIRNPPSGPR